MVVIFWGNHQAIFIWCAHLLVDALHSGLRDDVGGKTADHTKERDECGEYFLHNPLFLKQPVDLSRGAVETAIARVDMTFGKACYHDDALWQA